MSTLKLSIIALAAAMLTGCSFGGTNDEPVTAAPAPVTTPTPTPTPTTATATTTASATPASAKPQEVIQTFDAYIDASSSRRSTPTSMHPHSLTRLWIPDVRSTMRSTKRSNAAAPSRSSARRRSTHSTSTSTISKHGLQAVKRVCAMPFGSVAFSGAGPRPRRTGCSGRPGRK